MNAVVSLLIALVIATSLHAQFQNRPLLEHHTGAWCQYCPDGEVVASQIVRDYPQVIWVAFHNGDAMTIPTQDTLGSAYITGYPGATVDRRPYQNSIGLARNTWRAAVQQRLSAPVEAGVRILNVAYSPSTRRVDVTIGVVFQQTLQGEYRLNLYVVEDSVIGYGRGYDQANYYNNVSGHPYFGKGNPIVGHPHRYVVRQAVGGAWGIPGLIPRNPATGTQVTQTLSVTLPTQYNNLPVRYDRLSFVAILQKYGLSANDRPIINSDVASLPSLSVQISATQPTIKVPASALTTTTVQVTNPNNRQLTVRLEVDNTLSSIPQGWTVSLGSSTVTLPANGSTSVEVQITPTDRAGLAKIAVTATPQLENADILPTTTNTMIYALSEATRCVILDLGYESAAIGEVLTSYYLPQVQTAKQRMMDGKTVIMPATSQLLTAFPIYDFDLIVVPMMVIISRDVLPTNGVLATQLINAFQAGKKILITGSEATAYNVLANPNLSPPASVRQLLTSVIGIRSAATPVQRVQIVGQQYQFLSFNVQGQNQDPIGDGINVTCNVQGALLPTYFNDDVTLYSSVPTPVVFLRYQDNNKIAGIRREVGDGRIVLLTFTLESIGSSTARNSLLTRILNWLLDTSPRARMELIQTTSENLIQFDPTPVGQRRAHTFKIRNSGNADLVVSEITMDPNDVAEYGDVFVITNGGTTPITIPPSSEHAVTIEFRPKKVENLQIVVFRIHSNAGDVDLTVMGDGIQGSSVELSEVTRAGLSLSITPNPITSDATIHAAVNNTNVADLILLDSRGAEVYRVASGLVGANSISLDAATLSSGVYRLVLRSGAEQISVPVVVVK